MPDRLRSICTAILFIALTLAAASASSAQTPAAGNTGNPGNTGNVPTQATAPLTAPPVAPPVVVTPMAKAQDAKLRETLVGQWIAPVGNAEVELFLHPDGSYALDGQKGTFEIINGKLVLDGGDPAAGFNLVLANNYLTVSGGNLAQPLVFGRNVRIDRLRTWLVDWRPAEIQAKARRIFFIMLLLTAAWLIIFATRVISRWIFENEQGPTSYLSRRQRNRVLTIQSLVLNVIKYAVLFTTIGMILSELGVNYTAYLASLSVIGLAIGFGSQGLVQDMVTGVFVIFEGQYDVGDMVEISGQIGVVEELGLRMTRLRNYLGQAVVIPNRNIAIVGNYSKGAQRITIDVAIDPQAADASAEAIKSIVAEAGRQFAGVVVRQPRIDERITFNTGEAFVRVSLRIWPNQTWVIDQQFVPRIKEGMAKRELAIPGDRIAVFYYAREQLAAHPLVSKLMGSTT